MAAPDLLGGYGRTADDGSVEIDPGSGQQQVLEYAWAFMDAEASGDSDKLSELTAEVALFHADPGGQLDKWLEGD